jgi:hypothetical protein
MLLPTLLVLSLIVDSSSFALVAPSKTTTRRVIQQQRQPQPQQRQQQRLSWGASSPTPPTSLMMSDESYLDSLNDEPVEVDKEDTTADADAEEKEGEEEESSTDEVFVSYYSESPSEDAPDSLSVDDTDDTEAEEPSMSLPETQSAPTTTPPPASCSDTDPKTQDALFWLQALGAITGRGEFAIKSQKESAAKVLKTLEAANPTVEPARSDKSHGRWELVYAETHSFRASPFFLAGRAVCQTADDADKFAWFCDMHRAALAISQIEAVRQIVSPDGRFVSEFEVRAGAVPFLSDFTPFAYSGGAPLTVTGAIVSSADVAPTVDGTGWEMSMDSVEIKGSNLPGVRQILDKGLKLQSRPLGNWLEDNVEQYTKPVPVLRITYLDDMFRVSRDQDGNAYCYVKTSTSTELTDYARVDSDLGVLKLLGGFNDAVTKYYI